MAITTYTDLIYGDLGLENGYILWEELSRRYGWWDVTGDDNDKHFIINEKMEIVFRDFEKARTHILITTVYAKIVVIANGIEYEVYSCTDANFNPESRYFSFTTYGRYGLIFQLGTTETENDHPNDDPSLDDRRFSNSGTCVRFALFEARDYTHNKGRSYVGVYIPKTNGSITKSGITYTFTPFDPTPKYFLSEDSTELVSNGNLQFAYDCNYKVLALVPICSTQTKCITPNVKVSLIDSGYGEEKHRGQVGGITYDIIGGIYLPDYGGD